LVERLGNRGGPTRLKAFGASGYLVKPVRESQLFDCLARAFGTPETRAEVQEPVVPRSLAVGVRADAVSDGNEAIATLRRIPYDLVLMDVQMPEMNGMEATRIVRSQAGGALDPKIPRAAPLWG
jgi:CheY-like chemotaxis protein